METSKKKKARWRDQREQTVVLSQIPFSADKNRLEEFLKSKCDEQRIEISQIRLVNDKATRKKITERKHAGIAYVVCSDAEGLRKCIDGVEMDARKLGVQLLKDTADESGRVKLPLKVGRIGAEALAKRTGLELDDGILKALGKTSHFVASKVIKDAGKKKGTVDNISAYAKGVLNRLEREHVVAKTTPLETKKRQKNTQYCSGRCFNC